MNSIMKEYYPIFQMYQALRDQLMDILSDDDLSFRPAGENPTLGALCREIGEVEQSYITSFKTFKLDFPYRNEEAGLEANVKKLAAWFKQLDDELKAVVEALSEQDISGRMIDRGGDFKLSPQIQLNVYQEALLIFYGKASVISKRWAKRCPNSGRSGLAKAQLGRAG